jgi:hypothetical protein
MKRSIVALSLLLLPALAHAKYVPKTLKGKIAAELRQDHPELKFRATTIKMGGFLDGAAGEFTLHASRASAHGLAPTKLDIAGLFNAKGPKLLLTDVKIEKAAIQPID